MNQQTTSRANRRQVGAGTVVDPGVDVVALVDGWAAVGHGALPRRLAHALRHVITTGVVPAGAKLPPERTLATQLATSRATVTQALDELRADGLVVSRQGSGTVVAGPTSSPVGTRIAEHLLNGPGVDLATGNPPDLSHLPPIAVDMALLNAAGGGPAVNAAGLPALREGIAELHRTGVIGPPLATALDEIHVTSGAHQALALLLASLAGQRQTVAFAECNYPGLFEIIDTLDARPAPVRSDSAGMLPEALDELCRARRPAAVYVQCGPHNPTGKVSGRARLAAIAEVLDAHELTALEDMTLAPLTFGKPTPTLAELCRKATVVSIGSLSKTCWAGLRIGWMRGSTPLIEQTHLRHVAADLGPAVPSQLIALGLLPHLPQIIVERRQRLADSVQFAAERLRALIPEAEFVEPDGGSVLWTRFPLDDSAPLVRHARRFGVRVAPMSIHVAGRATGPYVRICVDRTRDQVAEGLDRLARAWRDLDSG